MPHDSNRRRFLQIAGGTGVAALAGCFSDDGSGGGQEDITITMGTSADGSSSWAIGQAMQAEVQRNSDSITVAAERTDGYSSNIGLRDEGGVDTIMVFNNMYRDAIEGQGIYEGEEYSVEDLGWQGMGLLSGEYMLVTREDTDIEYYQDLVGRDIATYPTGSGVHPVFHAFLNEALEISEDDFNRLDLDFPDYASALEQERIDACGFFTHNFGEVWSGTWQEVAARNNIRPLQIHPDYEDQARESWGDQLEWMEYPVVAESGEEGFEGVEAPNVFQVAFMVIDQDVPADAWREVTEIWVNSVDSIQEASPMLWDIDTEEAFTAGIYEDYPVHPGVAEFLQDQGWWDDAWTVGGEED